MPEFPIVMDRVTATALLEAMVEAVRQEHRLGRAMFAGELRVVASSVAVAPRSARALVSWVGPFTGDTGADRSPATDALARFLDVLDGNGKAAFDMDAPLPFIPT
jgi:hypothetical protein